MIIPPHINPYIVERLAELPDFYNRALRTFNWEAQIEIMANQARLKGEQREKLAVEIIMIILGVTSMNEFLHNLVSRVGLENALAQKINLEVRRSILSPIVRLIEPDTISADELQTIAINYFNGVDVFNIEEEKQNTEQNGIIENAPDILVPEPIEKEVFLDLDDIDHEETLSPQPKKEKVVAQDYTGFDPYHEPIE